jgi:hypothetical protein
MVKRNRLRRNNMIWPLIAKAVIGAVVNKVASGGKAKSQSTSTGTQTQDEFLNSLTENEEVSSVLMN